MKVLVLISLVGSLLLASCGGSSSKGNANAGDAYTEEETEMFRDVLYTTLDVEVAGWVRSLQLRGIELPDDLKDEVFLIIGERRNIEVKKADDR